MVHCGNFNVHIPANTGDATGNTSYTQQEGGERNMENAEMKLALSTEPGTHPPTTTGVDYDQRRMAD